MYSNELLRTSNQVKRIILVYKLNRVRLIGSLWARWIIRSLLTLHWRSAYCIFNKTCVLVCSTYNFGTLANAAHKYIVKEFTKIAEESNELMKLTRNEFKKIIDDNQLNVKREENVWEVLIKWVDTDPEKRKDDFLLLVPKVRFGLMDSKFFIENVNI